VGSAGPGAHHHKQIEDDNNSERQMLDLVVVGSLRRGHGQGVVAEAQRVETRPVHASPSILPFRARQGRLPFHEALNDDLQHRLRAIIRHFHLCTAVRTRFLRLLGHARSFISRTRSSHAPEMNLAATS
jgi:hypothetical protein